MQHRASCGVDARTAPVPHRSQVFASLPFRRYLAAMYRIVFGVLVLLVCLPACKKEEVRTYTVALRATCYDCVVQYAAGPDRGRYDTLAGSVVGADTLRESASYTLTMAADEALFFRACRLMPDSGRSGAIELVAEGEMQPFSALAGLEENCAVINQPVQFR